MAMKYLENRHVTLPQNQPGKPLAAGTVYVFGATQSSEIKKWVDVLQLSGDGSGSNQLGRVYSLTLSKGNRDLLTNSVARPTSLFPAAYRKIL